MSESSGGNRGRDHDFTVGDMRCACQARSDVGKVRAKNEDCLIVSPEKGLFGVCDGLGGHAAGEVASAIASETLCGLVSDPALSPEQTLKMGIEEANRKILRDQDEHPQRRGMGTTLTLLWLVGDDACQAWVGHVGDSRMYCFRQGELTQVTRDHSPVFRLYEQGALTKEQMHCHPQKNLLDRSLGIDARVEPEIFSIAIEGGDTLLLCTDGLSDRLIDEEIRRILEQYPIAKAADQLVSAANQKGGMDNISVVLVEILGS